MCLSRVGYILESSDEGGESQVTHLSNMDHLVNAGLCS